MCNGSNATTSAPVSYVRVFTCAGVVAIGNIQLCTFFILHPNDAKSKHNITDSNVKTTLTLNWSVARDVRGCHSSFFLRPKVKLVLHHRRGNGRRCLRRQLFRSRCMCVCLSSHKSLAAATFSHCIDTRNTWFRKRLLLLSLFIYYNRRCRRRRLRRWLRLSPGGITSYFRYDVKLMRSTNANDHFHTIENKQKGKRLWPRNECGAQYRAASRSKWYRHSTTWMPFCVLVGVVRVRVLKRNYYFLEGCFYSLSSVSHTGV